MLVQLHVNMWTTCDRLLELWERLWRFSPVTTRWPLLMMQHTLIMTVIIIMTTSQTIKERNRNIRHYVHFVCQRASMLSVHLSLRFACHCVPFVFYCIPFAYHITYLLNALACLLCTTCLLCAFCACLCARHVSKFSEVSKWGNVFYLILIE